MKLLYSILLISILFGCSDNTPITMKHPANITDEELFQLESVGNQFYQAFGAYQRVLEFAKKSNKQNYIDYANEAFESFELLIVEWREGKIISAERERELEELRLKGYQQTDKNIQEGMNPLIHLDKIE